MRALFESRAAVLKAEAEAKLLDKQLELERLRQSRDTTLLRHALEALERCVGTCFDRYAHEEVMSRPEHFVNQTITTLRERLGEKT